MYQHGGVDIRVLKEILGPILLIFQRILIFLERLSQ